MSVQNQLFEAVYYGTDLEFKYNGNYYFINSGEAVQNNVKMHAITVFQPIESFYEENKCLELAQNIPIFNGKTFWEAEPEMEWVEW